MRILTTATALTASLALAGSASAATIALSDSNTSATDTVDQVIALGGSGTVYIWVTPDANPITGLGLDFLSSDPAVLEATDMTIYATTYFGGFFQTWDGTSSGVLGDLVDESNAVAVTASGLNPGLPFDGVKDGAAFLVGEITFDATAEGVTNITGAVGDLEVADSTGVIQPDFVGGTVTVTPEPTSLALLGLGGLLVARRRKG